MDVTPVHGHVVPWTLYFFTWCDVYLFCIACLDSQNSLCVQLLPATTSTALCLHRLFSICYLSSFSFSSTMPEQFAHHAISWHCVSGASTPSFLQPGHKLLNSPLTTTAASGPVDMKQQTTETCAAGVFCQQGRHGTTAGASACANSIAGCALPCLADRGCDAYCWADGSLHTPGVPRGGIWTGAIRHGPRTGDSILHRRCVYRAL